MTPHRPDDEDDDARELIRAEHPIIAGPEALVRLIDQSNREAAASRAQARELIKALEGVQRSQEYLGVALREERRKSRWLLALLVVVPIVAAAAAWRVSRNVDMVQSDLRGRFDRLVADERTSRSQDAAKLRDVRVVELTGDVESLRRDLEASRDALAAERKHVADREAALAAAQSRGEAVKGELGAFEYEVKSAKAAASAEAARASDLENRIAELKADLEAKSNAPQPAPPPAVVAPSAADALVIPPAAPQRPESAVDAPTPAGGPADAEKARAVLNTLLMDAGDAVRYEFRVLGGVSGRSLHDVLVVGADDQGNVVRSIQAGRAEIAVDAPSGSVVIRFYDGKLIIGMKQAPFFDGSYGLVVRGDPAKWKGVAGWLLK